MLHEYLLTIPANTLATAPVEVTALLSPGRIVRVDVQFPDGCVDLVGVRILRSTHQVWPGNPDGDIRANGVVVTWPEDYDLADAPYELTLRGYSPGTVYQHKVRVRFAILSIERVREEAEIMGFWPRLRRAMRL